MAEKLVRIANTPILNQSLVCPFWANAETWQNPWAAFVDDSK